MPLPRTIANISTVLLQLAGGDECPWLVKHAGCMQVAPSSCCAAHVRHPMSGVSAADFDRLHSAGAYEQLIQKSVRGVPADWIPQVAQQCLYAPVSSSGKR